VAEAARTALDELHAVAEARQEEESREQTRISRMGRFRRGSS
jgi:hypothetical protein